MLPSLNRISQLQAWRGRKPVEPSIAGTIESLATEATRTQRRLGELADLWLELMPPEIATRTALAGLRSSVLHVIADSSATSFELDRLLRGGLETELRRRFRGTLVRVRVRVEALDGGLNDGRDRHGGERGAALRSSKAKAPQFTGKRGGSSSRTGRVRSGGRRGNRSGRSS